MPTKKHTDAACATFVKVPRVFLKLAMQGCVDWTKENGVTVIDEPEMKLINNKRSKEKRR